MTMPTELPGHEQKLTADYSRFLSIISHDLKAPLRHVREFSKLLVASIDSPNEDQEIFQGFIQGGVNKLDLMIESLVQLSRLTLCDAESQSLKIEPLLSDIVKELSLVYTDLTLDLAIQSQLSDVTGKPEQIKELFRHILENCFRHGKTGDCLKISIEEHSTDHHFVFNIVDCGVGIEERYSEKVFELFYKIDPGTYPDAAGSGLTFAKEIAKLHRGSVEIMPGTGTGTTVSIRLPKPAV